MQEIIAATISLSRSFQTPTCGTYVNKDIYSKRGHSLDHWQTTLNDLLFTSADLTLSSRACKLALNPGTENGSCQDSFLTIAYMCEKKRKQAPICLLMFFQCLPGWCIYLLGSLVLFPFKDVWNQLYTWLPWLVPVAAGSLTDPSQPMAIHMSVSWLPSPKCCCCCFLCLVLVLVLMPWNCWSSKEIW